ncbi:MAG TPA: extracellular solute-binding protein, partial [Rubrivivax sp.]|nr:extracellular solute-binding protein [Rubrivivax sp.]
SALSAFSGRAATSAVLALLAISGLSGLSAAYAHPAAAPSPTAVPTGGPRGGAPVAIDFARFFGACDTQFGSITDPAEATGECGIITVLTNRFNAQNPDVRVRTQIIEHRPYYSQIGGRVINRDVPAVAILHGSTLNDFVKRRLVEPLDAGFAEVGIDPAGFTPQARAAVTVADRTYALPLDTHSWLWHVNVNLLREAGLVGADGRPRIPTSEAELLEQARRFKAATGKPYFILLTVNDAPAFSRTLMTLVQQQGGSLFPRKPTEIDLASDQVVRAVRLLSTLVAEGLASRGHDYGAGIQAFVGGQGAVMINGTWLLGDLHKEAARAGRPLFNGYTALPFPSIYGRPGAWADNHLLVMLKGGTRTEAERKTALRFMRFIHDEGGSWARTGQLPTSQAVIGSASFKALPLRPEIAPLADFGAGLPQAVARQSRVTTMLGDALAGVVVHGRELKSGLASATRSINRMLERDNQFALGAGTPESGQ